MEERRRAGRKPLPPGRKRDARLEIHLTPSELEEVQAFAAAAGSSAAEVARDALLRRIYKAALEKTLAGVCLRSAIEQLDRRGQP